MTSTQDSGMTSRVAVIGASGAIGAALVRQFVDDPQRQVFALSRSRTNFQHANVTALHIDILDEPSIARAAGKVAQDGPVDRVLLTTGLLHDAAVMPEKSLRDIELDKMTQLFALNSCGPALVMKHFLPLLRRDRRAVFAALSARVGSITDNRLGGWYSYRASKAALNMLIRTASLEIARSNRQALVVGVHPGTVDSRLSAPFQNNVPPAKLFTAEYSASCLGKVIDALQPEHNGRLLAWDGQPIPF